HGQLELGGLFDRQIGWLCAAQNFVDEADDMPVTEQISRSIDEQAAVLGGFGPLIDRRQACVPHPLDNLEAPEIEERGGQYVDCLAPRGCQGVKCAAQFLWTVGPEPDELEIEVVRGARELGASRDRGRVGQHGDPPRLRDEFMQDFEPLYVQLRGENAHPGRIAAWPR